MLTTGSVFITRSVKFVGSAGTEGASRQTNKQMYNGKVRHIQARSL